MEAIFTRVMAFWTPAPSLQADVVDRGEKGDGQGPGDLAPVDLQGLPAEGQRQDDVLRGEEGQESPEVLAEAHGQGGDAARS